MMTELQDMRIVTGSPTAAQPDYGLNLLGVGQTLTSSRAIFPERLFVRFVNLIGSFISKLQYSRCNKTTQSWGWGDTVHEQV
jgi:hypothetical protein